METIIIICSIIFIIYFVAQDSKKETTKERYGEAIGFLAHSTANKIATVAHDIAEPASKKEFDWPRKCLRTEMEKYIVLMIILIKRK